MNESPPGYIDEYNQLRAEIRMYLEHGSRSLQIAMTLGAAAVTFGHKWPLLLLVSSAIVSYLWFDEIRHLKAVQRTATYIEVFVEPNVPGLNWETIGGKNKFDPSFFNRAIANAPFPTLIAVLLAYGFNLAKLPAGLGILAGIWVIGGLGVWSYWTAKHGRREERQEWERILGDEQVKTTAHLAARTPGTVDAPAAASLPSPETP